MMMKRKNKIHFVLFVFFLFFFFVAVVVVVAVVGAVAVLPSDVVSDDEEHNVFVAAALHHLVGRRCLHCCKYCSLFLPYVGGVLR